MNQYEHPLSWKALGRIILLVIMAALAWKAMSVIVYIIIALILATAVFPLVKKTAMVTKAPFMLATIIIFTLILVPFVLIGIFIVPTLIGQFPDLLHTFHSIVSSIHFLPSSIKNFDITTYINQHANDLLASTTTAIMTMISVITVFFLTFYFVLDEKQLFDLFLDLFPERERNKIKGMMLEIARVNGRFIRGNVIISCICTVIVFAGLTIINVPFALPLAIFAGIVDLLPLVGSTLGAIPALIIAFAISPLKGMLVLIFHLVYQQFENVVISPAIYNKTLNVSSALSFLSIVIGAGLFGILGAFLALPIAASIPSTVRYARDYSKRNQ